MRSFIVILCSYKEDPEGCIGTDRIYKKEQLVGGWLMIRCCVCLQYSLHCFVSPECWDSFSDASKRRGMKESKCFRLGDQMF